VTTARSPPPRSGRAGEPVSRFIRRLFNNWPLKLAAVGLATIMYGGLALSQNTQIYQGQIPVHYVNEPPDTVKLPSTPPPVEQIRFFAPSGVLVAASSFLATIDLADYDGKVGVFQVPISVISPDSRVRVLGFNPQFATVELDGLVSRADVPVKVVPGPVPDRLTLGKVTVDPTTVTVSGASSLVSQVESVRADVAIPAGGIDVDEDVRLVPVDKLGNALIPLEVTPATARVTIPVISNRQSRTLPINPIVTGTPAAGFEIESVSVDPQVALVAGDADELEGLARVDTDPVPLTGVSDDLTVVVGLALPTGVVAVEDEPITVAITIRPVTGTRTFSAGLRLVGANNTMTYTLSTDRVLVTIGGSTADLDRLSGAALVMDLDVTGLKAGTHDVPVTANLPVGTTLVAASPPTVGVTIGTGAATSPSGSASPPPGG
jgi:YbbR domain-containing protein